MPHRFPIALPLPGRPEGRCQFRNRRSGGLTAALFNFAPALSGPEIARSRTRLENVIFSKKNNF